MLTYFPSSSTAQELNNPTNHTTESNHSNDHEGDREVRIGEREQSSIAQKEMACVLSLGAMDWKLGGSVQGILIMKDRGMVPCTVTAIPSSQDDSNDVSTRAEQGMGVMNGQVQMIEVSMELDLEHLILDTGKSMPLLKREYKGMFRRDMNDLLRLMPVKKNKEEMEKEKEKETMKDHREGQEDQFVGRLFQNCTTVDHTAIVCEWTVSDLSY